MSIHFMPGIGSLVSALPILRVSRIVAFCLLTRVRNATLGLLRIISTIIGIVARCRVVRHCRLCALSLPSCVGMIPKVMTAGVFYASIGDAFAAFFKAEAAAHRRAGV